MYICVNQLTHYIMIGYPAKQPLKIKLKAPKPPKVKKSIGIYLIENKILNKFYIGKSKCIETRLRQHKWELKNRKSYNVELQNDWDKHSEHFVFTILDTTDDAKMLNALEKKHIEQFIADNKTLYNTIYVLDKQPNTIINIKKEYVSVIKQLITVLDAGSLSIYDLENQLNTY
jgi:hypothetical protein